LVRNQRLGALNGATQAKSVPFIGIEKNPPEKRAISGFTLGLAWQLQVTGQRCLTVRV
jgi:hypothetical protein